MTSSSLDVEKDLSNKMVENGDHMDVIVSVLNILNSKDLVFKEQASNPDVPNSSEEELIETEYFQIKEEIERLKGDLAATLVQHEAELAKEFQNPEILNEKSTVESFKEIVSQLKNDLERLGKELAEETVLLDAAQKELTDLRCIQTEFNKRMDELERSNTENDPTNDEVHDTSFEQQDDAEDFRQEIEDLQTRIDLLQKQIADYRNFCLSIHQSRQTMSSMETREISIDTTETTNVNDSAGSPNTSQGQTTTMSEESSSNQQTSEHPPAPEELNQTAPQHETQSDGFTDGNYANLTNASTPISPSISVRRLIMQRFQLQQQQNSDEIDNLQVVNGQVHDTNNSSNDNQINQESSSPFNSNSSSNEKHGQDMSKSHLGWFCICGKHFLSKRTFNSHYQPINEKKFVCYVCQLKFTFLHLLQKHLVVVHNFMDVSPDRFGCRYCGEIFGTKAQLATHSQTAHSNIPSPTGPKRRTQVHPPKPPVRKRPPRPIPVDPVTVKIETPEDDNIDNVTKKAKKRHGVDWSKARQGKYCLCGKELGRNLSTHIKYHNSTHYFECPECKFRFKATRTLKNHMLLKHKIVSTRVGCRECGGLFQDRHDLWKHKMSKLRRRKKIWEIVDLTKVPSPADTEEDVQGMQQETGEITITPLASSSATPSISIPTRTEPPITFDKSQPCAVPTPTSPPLIAEFKTRKPCEDKIHGQDLSKREVGLYCICGFEANSIGNLKLHIAYFALDWKFRCDLCGCRFLHISGLECHQKMTHSGVASSQQLQKIGIGCSLCGQIFTSLMELAQHNRTSHLSQNEEQVTEAISIAKITNTT